MEFELKVRGVQAPTEGVESAPEGNRCPTFIDLFAGCGGLSLGLLLSGWKGICAVEKDEFAFATFQANLIAGNKAPQFDWPAGLPVGPIRISKFLKLLKDGGLNRSLGVVDLVAGGPPCQGFSLAGRRRHDDPRNRLFREYIRAVSVLRPRLLLIENVPGVASKHGVRKLPYSDKIQRALTKIGYTCYSDIHRAADFGVPQERPRFFVIGVDSQRFPYCDAHWLKTTITAKLSASRLELLKRKGLEDQIPATVRQAIDDLRAYRRGVRLEASDVPRRRQVKYVPPSAPTAYQRAMRKDSQGSMDSMRLAEHSKEVTAKWKRLLSYCRKHDRRGVSLNSKERAILKTKKTTVVVLHPNRPSHTLTSLPDDVIHYAEPRILTVREYARLQSFPDWFVFRGKYTTGGHMRVQECPRYTQVANAVAPFVAEALGLTLQRLLSELEWLHCHSVVRQLVATGR